MSHPNGACVAAMTERDLAKNDQWPECVFSHIVGWLHARIIRKHEPLVLMLRTVTSVPVKCSPSASRDAWPLRDVSNGKWANFASQWTQ